MLFVEASLHTAGDRVRLTLNVIDAVELRQKESAFVDGVRGNALALQDAAVVQLVNMLDVEIQPKHARDLNRLNPLVPGAYYSSSRRRVT